MKQILGKKIGMTQIFDEDGVVIPVTVIQAGPVVVTQVKNPQTDGYSAIQVGYLDKKEKKINKPERGHFNKANVAAKQFLREFRLEEGETYELGQEILPTIFTPGDQVDVIGISKGKGTQGAIVRWGQHRDQMGHGSKSHRVAGARAASAYPGRVFPGTRGSGKTGHDRVTVQNLTVVRVDEKDNMLLVKGAIPGPKGGLVKISQAAKPYAAGKAGKGKAAKAAK